MDNSKLFLKIFSNCFSVKGINRSTLLDLQNDLFITIPTSMQEVIFEFQQKKSLKEVFSLYDLESEDIIKEYIDFIVEKGFGFICNETEFDLFIELNKKFELPNLISNAVLEMSNENISSIHTILLELTKANCNNLSLIFYEDINILYLIYAIKSCSNYTFNTLELVLKYSNELNENINEILFFNDQISNIIFHSSPKNYINEINSNILITFVNNFVTDCSYCGVINPYYYNVNKNKVLESLNHNSCLHKKISIDINGDIKNCPSMRESFGNIKDTTLEEALNHPNFKKYWNINKDQIDVCKDCEFRHVCTDCRAYIENPQNIYSKPLKCGYNPYTNEWSEWSTNPLKQKAIEYYGMQDLVKKDA